MAKTPKKKVHYLIPPANLPAVVRAKKMEDSIRELVGKNDTLRRLLWMAVLVAGNRIEIPEEVYRHQMKTPNEETLIKAEPELSANGTKVVAVVHCNERGETIDDPGPSRIITLPGAGR